MSTTFTGAINNEWHTVGNWSNGKPTASVDAVFDASSPNCHLDYNVSVGLAECRAMDMTGYTGALSSSNGPPFFILRAHGNVTLGASTGDLAVQIYGTSTLTTNGRLLYYLGVDTSGHLTFGGNVQDTTGVGEIDGGCNFNGHNYTTPGDMLITATATISGLAGSVITVGGNFAASASLVGSAAWSLDVTGTSVAHNATIAYCDASGGTALNASDNCVNGGNNINVTGAHTPATILWGGSVDSDPTNAANWQGGVAPVNGDHAVVDATATGFMSIAFGQTVTCASFSMTGGNMRFEGGTLAIGSGGGSWTGGTIGDIGNFAGGHVSHVTCTGNFNTTRTWFGEGPGVTVTVTGTATANGCTIAGCDFSGGTTLTATSCLDAGGNTNVDFVTVVASTTACLLMI